MSTFTEYTSDLSSELERYRPAYRDNSALRARLAGVSIEDRPIVTELHRVMAERDAFASHATKR
jgi:hypothetical protein